MRNLTDTQKKWALTACLLTALSFNLSAHIKADKEISRDFASEGIAFDVTNGKGSRDAKAWKTGDNGEYSVKIEAAPGCNCDGETVEVKVQTDKQGDDLKNLIKVATYAKLEAKKDTSKDKDEEESEDPNEDDDSLAIEESELQKEKLDKEFARNLKSECKYEDESKKASCHSRVFIAILKKYDKREKKDKRPSDDQASKWLDEEVSGAITDSYKFEQPVQPVITEFGSWGEYNEAVRAYREELSTWKKQILSAKGALQSLIERIPKGYPDTRKKLVQLVAAIQTAATATYAAKLGELEKMGMEQYQTKIASANIYRTNFQQVTQELDRLVNSKCTLAASASATCQAIKSGYITKAEASAIYKDDYGQFDNLSAGINNSIVEVRTFPDGSPRRNPMTGMIESKWVILPDALDSRGTDLSKLGGPGRSSREEGRGVVTRSGSRAEVIYTGNGVYQKIADVATDDPAPTSSVVTTSDVLTFFEEKALTEENRRIRADIHRQYRTP